MHCSVTLAFTAENNILHMRAHASALSNAQPSGTSPTKAHRSNGTQLAAKRQRWQDMLQPTQSEKASVAGN
jgi:hypothetical protein